jgi:Zn-dependent protease
MAEISSVAVWLNVGLGIAAGLIALVLLVSSLVIGILSLFGKATEAKKEWSIKTLLPTFILFCIAQFLLSVPFQSFSAALNILQLVIIVWSVIFVHEMGHYVIARINNAKVEEFSIGFGKKLMGFTFGGTSYNLRLAPIGGYVKVNEDDLATMRLLPKIIFLLFGITLNVLCYFIAIASIRTENFFTGIQYAYYKLLDFVSLLSHVQIGDIFAPERDMVGQWTMYNDLAQAAIDPVILFAGFSLFVAIINSLPIPNLDGGRVILAICEKIADWAGIPNKKIKKTVNWVLAIGLLITLSPAIINNIWSAGAGIGFTLTETILWYALIITIIGNIKIFVDKRSLKNATKI